jgi:hypothetical protein
MSSSKKKRAALSSRPKLAKSTLLEGERCALVEGASAESNNYTDPIKNGLTLLFSSRYYDPNATK